MTNKNNSNEKALRLAERRRPAEGADKMWVRLSAL